VGFHESHSNTLADCQDWSWVFKPHYLFTTLVTISRQKDEVL
jgi:hypothetical protein